MSDIINPLTTRVFYEVPNLVAELFVDSGLYEYHRPKQATAAAGIPQPARPTENTFAIGRSLHGKVVLMLTTPSGEVQTYSGEPNLVYNAFKSLKWDAAKQERTLQGPNVPEAIVREYATQHSIERGQREATAAQIARDREAGAR
jgi:hypothetical protein